jgi:exosortase
MSTWITIVPILGWWIFALSYQWRTQPEYSFGWVNLILTIVIISKTMDSIPKDSRANLPSKYLPVLLTLLGMPIVLLAELYGNGVARSPVYAFTLSIGTILFLLSWGIYNFNFKTVKLFVYPLCFFLLCVPIPKLIWNPLVLGLQSIITELNIETLQGIGIPARQAGNLIIFQKTTVGVDEACSGVRSLQSMTMSSMFLGFLYFNQNKTRVVIALLGIFFALCGNFLRSFVLCLLSYYGGDELFEVWHDKVGWGTMLLTLSALLVGIQIFKKINERQVLHIQH